MTFDEALRFWFARVNFEQRTPLPSDLKLDRMRALLDRLGNPQDTLRIVHVAGSKGKGSISAMLSTMLRCAGYRTGLFTSPHLSATEERIQVDGCPIRQEELAALMTQIKPCVEAVDAKRPSGAAAVTFFEIATALGFMHFARRRVQAAVIEVGLGGRFDSTNVCRPVVSIISSISYDHVQQLGNTLSKIAMEKAGIVKPGRPTVSGARAPEARTVIEQICRERRSPLRQLDVDFHYRHVPGEVTAVAERLPRVEVTTRQRTWPAMDLRLFGDHQAANAAVTVAAVEVLRQEGLRIDDAAVARGLATVVWPARLEVVARRPLVVLDCAHNVASAQALVDTLATSFPVAGQRRLVFGASSDKDLPGMLQLLGPYFDVAYLTRYTSQSRSVPPEELLQLWQRVTDHPATVHPTAAEAWHAAHAAAAADDLICVTGSVFLAGELRKLLV